MADIFKTIRVSNPSTGPLQESLVGAISVTSGTVADAFKVILTDASGMLDGSFGGGGGGSVTSVNGFTGVVVLQLAQTFSPVSNEFLTAYNASTGLFTAAQPSFSGISGSIATGQIGALTVTVAQINASGTPSSSTFLRGDGTWATVSASPGGSSGDIQYNNSSVFGGSAATITAGGSITIPSGQVLQVGTSSIQALPGFPTYQSIFLAQPSPTSVPRLWVTVYVRETPSPMVVRNRTHNGSSAHCHESNNR